MRVRRDLIRVGGSGSKEYMVVRAPNTPPERFFGTMVVAKQNPDPATHVYVSTMNAPEPLRRLAPEPSDHVYAPCPSWAWPPPWTPRAAARRPAR